MWAIPEDSTAMGVCDAMAMNLPITVCGEGWSNFIPQEAIGGDFIENHQLAQYYAHCKILLCGH